MSGLEVLDVSYNNLHDLYGMNFSDLSVLKILNVSNNEIGKLEYIDSLCELKELDISKNKLR